MTIASLTPISPGILKQSAEVLQKTGPFTSGPVTTNFFELVIIDLTNGDITVNLPAITVNDVGKSLRIKDISLKNNFMVINAGAATIDGATTKSFSAWVGKAAAHCVVLTGTTWGIL